MFQEYTELAQTKDVTAFEIKNMRCELKEYKLRETRYKNKFHFPLTEQARSRSKEAEIDAIVL